MSDKSEQQYRPDLDPREIEKANLERLREQQQGAHEISNFHENLGIERDARTHGSIIPRYPENPTHPDFRAEKTDLKLPIESKEELLEILEKDLNDIGPDDSYSATEKIADITSQ